MADVESDRESSADSLAKDIGTDESIKSIRSGRSEKSSKLETRVEDDLEKQSNANNGLTVRPKLLDDDTLPSKPSGDDPKMFDEGKGTKGDALLLVRSRSSPAFYRRNNERSPKSNSKTIEERRQLSDVTHMLFSTKNLPTPPTNKQKRTAKLRDAKEKGSRSDVQEAKPQPASHDDKMLSSIPLAQPSNKQGKTAKHRGAKQQGPRSDTQETKTQSVKHNGKTEDKMQSNTRHLAPMPSASPTNEQEPIVKHRDAKQEKGTCDTQETNSQPANHDELQSTTRYIAPSSRLGISHANYQQTNDGIPEIIRRATMPEKRELEAIERINEYQRNNLTPKSKRSTISGGHQIPSSAKSKAPERDLLSRFITYNDQLPPTPTPATSPDRQYKPLPQHTPKSEKRLSKTKKRQREHTQASRKRMSTSSDGVQMCSIPSRIEISDNVSPLHSPESQRPVGLLKSSKLKSGGGSSLPETPDNQNHPRSILPHIFDILRIIAIMFATASLTARSFIMFGGKIQSLWHYISNSPTVWIVRFYISLFHVVLIIVELNIGVPVFIPKGTLDNFIQKGFFVSFIGLLDLMMNTNRSLADIVEEFRDGTNSAFTVLGISSRGLAVCGLVYILFGLMGFNGESRRRLANTRRNVGLEKTRKASI